MIDILKDIIGFLINSAVVLGFIGLFVGACISGSKINFFSPRKKK